MLSVNSYSKQYIADRSKAIDDQVAAYRRLARVARKEAGKENEPVDKALTSFEAVYFNALVIVLDTYFCHRARTMEGKDGNAMNEVRLLCTSLMENGGVLMQDKSIKLKPDLSVLGLDVGDRIQLGQADFVKLADAYFARIEQTYSSGG
jgi:hypothetical protein